MYVAAAGYPALTDVRAWIKVAATNLSDAELEKVAGAEQTLQAGALVWPGAPDGDIPDDVYQAFMRRVARHVDARGIPLGIIGLDSEFGTSRLPRWDAEVDRLEAPYLMVPIA